MHKIISKIIILSLVFVISDTMKAQTISDSWLKNTLIKSKSKMIQSVIDSQEVYDTRIQITEIIRYDNDVSIKNAGYHDDIRDYFYPASTVKLPVAILALEKVGEMKQMTSETPFRIESDSIVTTIRDEIRKIMAVSSNEAYNRLFEFLGQDYINNKLQKKGIRGVLIRHRLSTPDSDNLYTKNIYLLDGEEVFDSVVGSMNHNLPTLNKLRNTRKGKGYYSSSELIDSAMNFELKNYFSLNAMTDVMLRLFASELFTEDKLFNLTAEDREFLLMTMSASPQELGFSATVKDTYGKFLIVGDKEKYRNSLKIYNKVGYAYGQVSDVAYVYDEESGREYIICASIYVNRNEILNDDEYQFDEVAIPFLGALGRLLLEIK